MDPTLLATKARIPPHSRSLVPRARLVDTLVRDIPTTKLTLVSAPAGYGKSTLLAQWAHASHLPVAWLSLGEEDNDPESFFRYLLAAWEAIQPGVGESPFGLLLGALSPPPDAVIAAFIAVTTGLPTHAALVLDDLHLITEPSIHLALTFLLDHLPAHLHIVLVGRGDPPLPLARYRVRHELLEIRADTLQLTLDETTDFLNRLMGLDLTQDEIAPLHADLEGWVAGVQLASLTLRHPRGTARRRAITGRHRFIADYLHDDVLAQRPAAIRTFLRQTCLLDRLCAGVCAAVTGADAAACQAMLDLLERENLFLQPLDDSREWFRYHRLFADVVHEDLLRHHPGDIAALHRRAARWYLTHDLPEPAFHHALAGDDVALVVHIIERYVTVKLFGGETRIVKQWLDALPAAWNATYPELGLARTAFLLLTGQVDASARCLDGVERLALAEPNNVHGPLARVAAVRCFIACFRNDLEQAETYADRALRDLPDADVSFRADIYHALGETYRGNGRWQEADAHYRKVLDLDPDPAAHIRSAHVFGALADLELRQGHLRGAAVYWRQALAAIQDRETWGRLPLPVIGWVHLRTAELHYEWNDLATARDHLSRGLECAELGGDIRTLIAGYLTAARISLTDGGIEAAASYMERARPLVEQSPFSDWTSHFERRQLDLWLAQDRLDAATAWVTAALADEALPARPDSESIHLAIARVLIVRGDLPSHHRASLLLESLRHAAAAGGRMSVQIEALALLAIAHWRDRDRTAALPLLEQALRLAEPEGYVRLFADLGLPMARLLQEAHSRRLMPDYVATLLTACGADLASPAAGKGPLPEPLSRREREVLHLIAAGLTNREIAVALTVSPETVKKHSASIFAKLGAGNRTAAAAKARILGILDENARR